MRRDNIIDEEKLLSFEDGQNGHGMVDIGGGDIRPVLDNTQEGTKTTCPPPVVVQENNDVTHTAPTVCVEGRTVKDDIAVTLHEGVVEPRDGVSVCGSNGYNDDVGDAKTGQQKVLGDKVWRGDDNKTGGGGGSLKSVHTCEFKRGW